LAKHNEIVTAINDKQKKIDELQAKTRLSNKQQADLTQLQSEQGALIKEQQKFSDGKKGLLHDNGDLEFDPATNTWRKKLELRKDVQTVDDQFNPTGEKNREVLQREFEVLSKDSSEATYLAARQKQGNTLIDDYLSTKGSKKISKTFDVTVEQEFKNLSPEERAEVLKILNKPLNGEGKISEEDLDALNFYTLKNSGQVSGDVAQIKSKRTAAVKKDAAKETIKLDENLGLNELSVLMRQSGVPAKINFTEVE
jgi:predicted NUDIX family phosphoesterase